MVTGEIVYGETSVAGTGGTEAILIHIGQRGSVVDRREVVLDILTTIVSGDLLGPLLTITDGTATIRRNHDEAGGGKGAEVPAVAPELCHRTLRTTLAEEDGGVLLIGVKVGREDKPSDHILTVCRLDNMALYGHIGIVSEEGIIVRGQLRCLTLSHVVSKGGGRLSHRLNGEEHILTLAREAGHVSKVVLRHLLRLTGLDIDTKEIRRTVIRGNETELLATGTPAQLLRVVLVVL